MLKPNNDALVSLRPPEAFASMGESMLQRIRQWYPICRSITGEGNRQTLKMLAQEQHLHVHEIPSGTPVFDWQIPQEWTIRDAWIKGPDGQKIVDFKEHALHVVGYSVPIHETLSREALLPYLHSLPEFPDWIPYRTSYYEKTWGFCLRDRDKQELVPGNYEVMIDAELKDGSLTYAEAVFPGESRDEFLISVHICHPALANDNLSSLAVAESLMSILRGCKTRYTYRFLFIPGTIGSIAWLALNPEARQHIRHGLVLSCMGDTGHLHYKRSRDGQSTIDRTVDCVFKEQTDVCEMQDFSPYGYDERQYGSPGINLPVGLLTRSPHGTFPEYHTSADNPDFLSATALGDSLRVVLEVLALTEADQTFVNQSPMGEPQLGRRGLYDRLGGGNERKQAQLALLWMLNQSDGDHSLLDIALRSGMPWRVLRRAADQLLACGLLDVQRDKAGV